MCVFCKWGWGERGLNIVGWREGVKISAPGPFMPWQLLHSQRGSWRFLTGCSKEEEAVLFSEKSEHPNTSFKKKKTKVCLILRCPIKDQGRTQLTNQTASLTLFYSHIKTPVQVYLLHFNALIEISLHALHCCRRLSHPVSFSQCN